MEIKGLAKDFAHNCRKLVNIDQSQHKGYGNINYAHDGYQGRGGCNHATTAAKEAVAYQHSQNTTNYPRGSSFIIEGISDKGGLQIIRAKHIKAHAIGSNQSNAKDNSQSSAAQSSLNIVGRTAVAAVLTTLFVNLGQCAFDKSRSTAYDGDNPHPEYCTITTQADSGRNTNNIARADTGCSGNHQGLEGRNSVLAHRLFQNHANSFLEHTQLHQASAQSVVQAHCHQHHYQQIAVHKITNSPNNTCKHQKTSSFNSYLLL